MSDSSGIPRRKKTAQSLRTLIRRYPYRVAKIALARFEIRTYLRRHSARYLNIGGDANRPNGWLNADIFPTFGVVYLDATVMSPLPTASFDAVLCEHMIEHVSQRDGFEICRQIHRILKPGGVVRLVTPDLDRLARLVQQPTADDERYLELLRNFIGDPRISYIDAVNLQFRNYGHQYLYNRGALREMLVTVGFSNIVETPASGYRNPVFRGVQGHAVSVIDDVHGNLSPVGEELNNLEAFGFEAER